MIASYPRFRPLPIILSEADPEGCAACSSKVDPANNYRNGTLYPAYTAAAYKRLFDLQDKYKVNLFGMLSWSFEFENREYFEGFRSLSTNGIDEPILNFFRMAGMMNGTRVATASSGALGLNRIMHSGVRSESDVDALATRSNGNTAAIMLWNYHDADGSGPVVPVSVTIAGMPPAAGHVLVSQYRIDDTHSNAYTVWQAMGSPQHPTTEQYEKLKANAGLQLLSSPMWMEASNGTVRLTADLPRQSISLVTLQW